MHFQKIEIAYPVDKFLIFFNFEKRIVISVKNDIERATLDMCPLKSSKNRTTLLSKHRVNVSRSQINYVK